MVTAPAPHAILERLLDPQGKPLSRELAEFFLRLSFTDAELGRIAELSEKANEGELSDEEYDELFTYVLLKDFLTILHLRAESVLRGSPSTA